jgi:hypothetical protein
MALNCRAQPPVRNVHWPSAVSLKRRLAEFGFESNDHFDFALSCLFQPPPAGVRLLNVCGASARRNSAFASALGHALNYPRQLKYDFSDPIETPAVSDDDDAVAVAPLDRVLVEACAFSEAEPTIVVLDQLHRAPFREHIRLYHFATSREWTSPIGTVVAHPKNLLVVLIADEPLYLSLQKVCFRLWCDPLPGSFDYRPEEFGLARDAQALFQSLRELFAALEAQPTASELKLLLDDLRERVISEEQLRQALFGRIDSVKRERLYAAALSGYLRNTIETLLDLRGGEAIELGSG